VLWLRLIGLLLAISLLAAGWYYFWPRQINATRGRLFPLPGNTGPYHDLRRATIVGENDSLAGTPGTMAQEGCAVSFRGKWSSHSMGFQLDPGQLNQFLIAHEWIYHRGVGYAGKKAADFASG